MKTNSFDSYYNCDNSFKSINELKKVDFDIEFGSSSLPNNLEYSKDMNIKIDSNKAKVIVSVFDVASYILNNIKDKECSTMKLHKLLYYCQAWTLVWTEKPLFSEKIEAWSNGPVIRELFNFHKGLYTISINDFSIGNCNVLTEEQKGNINDVLSFYADKTAQWLIDLTHSESPWINARKGLLPNERGTVEISLDDISEYYSSL